MSIYIVRNFDESGEPQVWCQEYRDEKHLADNIEAHVLAGEFTLDDWCSSFRLPCPAAEAEDYAEDLVRPGPRIMFIDGVPTIPTKEATLIRDTFNGPSRAVECVRFSPTSDDVWLLDGVHGDFDEDGNPRDEDGNYL